MCLTSTLLPAEAVSFTKGWGSLKPQGCCTRAHNTHVVTAVPAVPSNQHTPTQGLAGSPAGKGQKGLFFLPAWLIMICHWLAALSHKLHSGSQQLPQFLFPSHILPFIFQSFLCDYE